MWWNDTETGECFQIWRWGWNWLALYQFRLFAQANPDENSDYLQFYSLDLGPVNLKLPVIRFRRDRWWKHKS